MNIEKLGIKSQYKISMVNGSTILALEQQRDKLLEICIEMLIESINKYANNFGWDIIRAEKVHSTEIEIIEKACYPKTWEEIKELL